MSSIFWHLLTIFKQNLSVAINVTVWSSHSMADEWHFDGYDIAMM